MYRNEMKNLDWDRIPRFNQLPVQPGAPPESSWGVFGDDDQFGCLNFLTPQGVIDAARLVKTGQVFRLDAKVGFAKPALFGRAAVTHQVLPLAPFANDDLVNNYNTQESSQWDGLAHVGHFRLERYYNGVQASEIGPGGKLSIHQWGNRFVGRGALIDAFGFRKAQGRDVQPLERDVFTLADLKGALEHQGTTLQPGTILLVRTGWMESYEKCSPEKKTELSSFEKIKSAGIEASREMVEWLWDQRVAAIGTDCPAVEPLPSDFSDEKLLHYRALPLLGLPLGELFILALLAEDCAQDRRYEFMVVSAPMLIEGGIATPPNAVAIK
jgi:kynurenine formamidase